jgi:SAM-dependent methyltransferase
VFNRYLELVQDDVKAFFRSASEFQEIPCPACGNPKNDETFKKGGFSYCLCVKCQTLFTNPRPPLEDLIQFYASSPSTSYWVTEFFMPVAEVRREKIFKPRAESIAANYGRQKDWIIGDIGAGFGLFLAELRNLWPDNKYIAIEPSTLMADICRQKELEVISAAVEDVSAQEWSFDFLTCFELFEHLHNPFLFLEKVYSLLRPGGHFVMTTLNSNGFDIQLLWEKSKSVFPPPQLNFFNPKSITNLLERAGFDQVVVSTPGVRDWDIVDGMHQEENVDLGRFWNLVSREVDGTGKKELQEWIVKNS